MTIEKPDLNFESLTHTEAQRLFTLPRESKRWGGVLRALISGQAVFIPHMSRGQLETLRGTVRDYQLTATLHSRTVTREGVEGRVLRLQQKA